MIIVHKCSFPNSLEPSLQTGYVVVLCYLSSEGTQGSFGSDYGRVRITFEGKHLTPKVMLTVLESLSKRALINLKGLEVSRPRGAAMDAYALASFTCLQ
ncbi:hypothetical protein ACFX13_007774 [Malus domestica]